MIYHVMQIAALLMCVMLADVAPVAAQTCRSGMPLTHPDGRLIDQRNGTVIDSATGLMWKQCAEGQSDVRCGIGAPELFPWQQALQRGAASIFAGYSDWRLPNKNELESLVERSCFDPAINATVFPNTQVSRWFWSSSPRPNKTIFAWSVDFRYGYVGEASQYDARYVRLVRGGR